MERIKAGIAKFNNITFKSLNVEIVLGKYWVELCSTRHLPLEGMRAM